VLDFCVELRAEQDNHAIGPPKPLGNRGAVMADTVGRAVA
jgi:hypothetical protein